MSKIFLWFFLSCKRYLKRLPFAAILLVLPVCAWIAGRTGESGDDRIRIAVCAMDTEEESLGARLADRLTGGSAGEGAGDGMFLFYRCQSEEEVRDAVASKKAECGYVIYEGLSEKLDAGKWKRAIGVYSAPSTVVDALSTETVFAEMIRLYDKELLVEYVETDEVFESLGAASGPSVPGSFDAASGPGGSGSPGGSSAPGGPSAPDSSGGPSGSGNSRKDAAKKAGELYEKWSGNGSTFRFEYEYWKRNGTPAETGQENSAPKNLFPVRGISAILVFITGLYGAVVSGEDERRGLFLPLSYSLKLPCRLAALSAPVALSACSGLLAIALGGMAGPAGEECMAMAVFAAAVTCFSWILKTILRKPEFLACALPFFIIGSLIFCPVFVDVGRLFPEFDRIGRLFLPYYYLRHFF